MSAESRQDTYPPHGHILRHLRMELELRDDETLLGAMPILNDLRDEGGALRFGALATLIDVAAGTFSHELVRPDWLATTDLKLHSIRPAVRGPVTSVTRTVRNGRRSILSETIASDADGEVARGWVTYARLPRRDDTPHVEGSSRIGTKLVYVETDEPTRPTLDGYVGIERDPEHLTIHARHHPRIHNSFGSIQGGVAAILVEHVATAAGERHLGGPCRVTDLQMYYLGQTRSGPFRVDGTVLRVDERSVTVEAAVVDAGNDDLLLDLGTATAQLI